MEVFSVRRSDFSLEMRAIRPSGGLRDKKEKRSTHGRLRVDSEIGSFFKLLEVEFSPYLGFIPILNFLLMFRLNETVRGRWIGPKTWDRIIGNIFFAMVQP